MRHKVPLRRRAETAAPKPNAERRGRRRSRYHAFFSTALWRAFRERVFARDRYQCVRDVAGVRCENGRANDARLICNHMTYARFGGRELLDDCETLCIYHDAAETTQTRVNWKADVRADRRGSFTSLNSLTPG